jgi:hypothetical protein
MSYDLKTLAQHRETLLLAEVAAWLHDDFKHTDGHIANHVTGAPSPSGRQDTEDLIPSRNLSMLGKPLSFSVIRKRKRSDFVQDYLNRCHYTAHIEKEDGDGPQTYPAYLSSPFGYEDDTIPTGLTVDLRTRITWNLPGHVPFTDLQRAQLRKEISRLFARVGGDTRRPINEITLWEWGHTVGALYKSALAGALLGFQPQANDLRWRLLSIRFNGLTYFTESHQLPDLLARRELLGDALNNVRELLEVTYPLGTEVYRDENGSLFVVPGCEKGKCGLDVLALTDNGKSLQQLVFDQVRQAIAEERVPKIRMDEEPWWGQDPQRQGNDELPPLAEHLSPAATHSNPDWVAKHWQARSDDICTVCGLRPQGPSSKSQDRGVCDTCEQRRADRSEEWATQDSSITIWTDEVSDTNGRLAFIIGHFDLTRWMDGSMIQTLTVVDPINTPSKTAEAIAKNSSFARIQRAWRTTHQFWQEIQQCFKKELTDDRRRLLLWLDQTPDLGRYHTYELEVGATTLSLACHPPSDGQTGYFISADNLGYTARQLGAEKKIYTSPAAAAIYVEDYLQEHFVAGDQSPVLHNPEATGARRKNLIAGHSIVRLEYQEAKYATAIPILTEPRTFMALVPANRALDVIQAIKQKYEREMGKVRNRLPLHLGVVYFHRRTPLRAALDAGQRMLEQRQGSRGVEGRASLWRVAQDVEEKSDSLPDHLNYLAEDTQQFEGWYPIKLQQKTQEITWHVPAVMGDGETKDVWYPYVFLETDHEPLDRDRRFQAPNPWSGDDGWLVHAGDLKQDDVVYFTPATFDFEHLDTTTRRFEVSYAHGRRRGADKAQRPYLLDDLARIEDVWQTLRDGLSTSQIKALETLIETKRRDWEKPKGAQALALPDDDPFRQICRDALANAEWRGTTWQNIPKVKREQLVHAAVSGVLADAIELHLTIAKEEIDPKHKETI